MNEGRKEYQRLWVRKKRKRLRTQKEHVIQSESSDIESSAIMQIKETQCNKSCDARKNCSDTDACYDTSSDEDVVEQWKLVDLECSRRSSSDDGDSDSASSGSSNLKSEIKTWAFNCGVTHRVLNELLPVQSGVSTFLKSH
jgi:hypothetical protein